MPSTSAALPDNLSHRYDEAIEAYQAQHFDVAQALVDRILAIVPEHAESLHLRGLLALAFEQLEAAQTWVERAIERHPQPLFYNTLNAIQLRLGNFAGAVESIRSGLTLGPNFAVLHYNLGLTLQYEERLEEAAISYRRALDLNPVNSPTHNNLGLILKELGAFDEAEAHYRGAISLAPNNLVAHNNLGNLLLTAGRFEEAWPYFEARWVTCKYADGRPAPVRPELPLPRWEGPATQSEHGREGRLLVLHEQGYGDSLQFVRYLPLVLERFSKIGYVCPPALHRLYEHSLCSRWPELELLASVPTDLHGWDQYCPLMSLPMAFGTRLDTIPAPGPYLYADPAHVASCRAKFAALQDPKLPRVGIVWAGGNSGIAVDRKRSLTSAQMAPLLALPHVHWISLQKTDDFAKLPDAASKAQLIDWTDELTDFADTAALIENLDLVISVDTSVAHLAAAMGKPVWLLNRFSGCWRWLSHRDDSPWYPTLRLFTQTQRGNWDDVLARVVTALRQRFST
jgi:tetratricopeptide (TPR) repeat protein